MTSITRPWTPIAPSSAASRSNLARCCSLRPRPAGPPSRPSSSISTSASDTAGGVQCRVVGLLIVLLRNEIAVDSGEKVPQPPEVVRVRGFRSRGHLDPLKPRRRPIEAQFRQNTVRCQSLCDRAEQVRCFDLPVRQRSKTPEDAAIRRRVGQAGHPHGVEDLRSAAWLVRRDALCQMRLVPAVRATHNRRHDLRSRLADECLGVGLAKIFRHLVAADGRSTSYTSSRTPSSRHSFILAAARRAARPFSATPPSAAFQSRNDRWSMMCCFRSRPLRRSGSAVCWRAAH